MTEGSVRLVLAGLLVAGALSACDVGRAVEPPAAESPASSPPVAVPSTPPPSPSAAPEPEPPPLGTVAPAWLGTRVLPLTPEGYGVARPTPRVMRERRWNTPDSIPPLPGAGFQARLASPAPDDVVARSTWRPGCPVDRSELAWLRLTYRGFDGGRHFGELLVNRAVADDLVEVFGRLYEARFPLESMGIEPLASLDLPPTGDGNTTGAFVCRPVTGGTEFSQHAYGLALDLNPFQNPYLRGDVVLPELASAYLDRGWVRPGMVLPDSPVVRAFAAVGWEWGGDWSSLKDYQHFSLNGR